MTIHELKTWPEFFQEIYCGSKTFEVRTRGTDEEPFCPGDVLVLREYERDTHTYTGRYTCREVAYVLEPEQWQRLGMSVKPDVWVMAIRETP